jgi:hypothetical protein
MLHRETSSNIQSTSLLPRCCDGAFVGLDIPTYCTKGRDLGIVTLTKKSPGSTKAVNYRACHHHVNVARYNRRRNLHVLQKKNFFFFNVFITYCMWFMILLYLFLSHTLINHSFRIVQSYNNFHNNALVMF